MKIHTSPHSEEAERYLLGSIMSSVNKLNRVIDLVDIEHFYIPKHKIIYQVILECYEKDEEVDAFIVSEKLKNKGLLKEIGGVEYLVDLAEEAGASVHLKSYARIIRDKALTRTIISTLNEVKEKVAGSDDDPSDLLSEVQERFFAISQGKDQYSKCQLKDILTGRGEEKPFLEKLQERQELFRAYGKDGAKVVGFPTHFCDLDRLINGFKDSNLMILAGRPGMGKTALGLNFAENICFKNNKPVAIFSLEMSSEQLITRLVSSQSEVDANKLITGSLDGNEFQRVVEAVKKMENHTLIIDDQAGLKITDLRSRARRLKEAYDIGFIVIDYLQLLSGSGSMRSTENRQLEVSEISRLLKTLARELDIPLLCLSQLSRKVEERHNHRPMLSDLRESGCLHGDTKIIDATTQKEYTIAELANRKVMKPMKVYAIDQNNVLGIHTLTKAFYSGMKKLFLLQTSKKKTIKATANHKFRIRGGWKPLGELAVGDEIATVNEHFEAIEMIKPLGVEAVYDATVDDVHNFLANDIIVHNSIEQDSDLIMLLLRHDYYDPEDRPGEAELNVAKNRHGAVGSVNLVYRKELVRFDNHYDVR